MLSIDITDKQLKLVKGSLAGNKIRVNDVDTRDVPDKAIVNGYITDIPLVAGELTDMLESKKINDKEITVCINSSAILYKELEVPKPKSLKNSAAIEAMIIAQMGISHDYNISYSIVGESVDTDKKSLVKLIATACPQRMVDGYQRLFSQLGLKLKQVNISNNCITRLILNTPKLKEIMPFLCIQVDVDFVNINLYENGQISLSRYIKVDPSDYENNPDYINIAVFDNLFRTIQFIGQRADSRPIKQILFYGIIKDFVSLSNAISSFNIPAHVLAMPNNIVKFCEVDFSRYANAIGAFYKVDPLYEHINLLQSKAVKGKKASGGSVLIKVLLTAAVSTVAVFGAYMYIDSTNKNLEQQITQTDAQLRDQKYVELERKFAEMQATLENFERYKTSVMLAKILFDFQPRFLPQINEELDKSKEYLLEKADKDENGDDRMFGWQLYTLNNYTVTLNLVCNDLNFPSDFAEALNECGYFENIQYFGFGPYTDEEFEFYNGSEDQPDDDEWEYKFTISMNVKPGHANDGGKKYEWKE